MHAQRRNEPDSGESHRREASTNLSPSWPSSSMPPTKADGSWRLLLLPSVRTFFTDSRRASGARTRSSEAPRWGPALTACGRRAPHRTSPDHVPTTKRTPRISLETSSPPSRRPDRSGWMPAARWLSGWWLYLANCRAAVTQQHRTPRQTTATGADQCRSNSSQFRTLPSHRDGF